MNPGPAPHFDDIRHRPIRSDADAVGLIAPLLGGAIRRQLWVLFLDAKHRPLPLAMPMMLPKHPEATAATSLGQFLRDVSDAETARGVIVVYERRGREDLLDSDRQWLRVIRDACVASGLTFRGPYLCHTGGVCEVDPSRLG